MYMLFIPYIANMLPLLYVFLSPVRMCLWSAMKRQAHYSTLVILMYMSVVTMHGHILHVEKKQVAIA